MILLTRRRAMAVLLGVSLLAHQVAWAAAIEVSFAFGPPGSFRR